MAHMVTAGTHSHRSGYCQAGLDRACAGRGLGGCGARGVSGGWSCPDPLLRAEGGGTVLHLRAGQCCFRNTPRAKERGQERAQGWSEGWRWVTHLSGRGAGDRGTHLTWEGVGLWAAVRGCRMEEGRIRLPRAWGPPNDGCTVRLSTCKLSAVRCGI